MIRTASLIALAACAAFAQPAAAPAAFEVASVKRAEGGTPPGDIPRNMDKSPGHFAMHNVPLRFCLEWAYDLKDYEISGPDWIKADERYDIIAKAPGPASDDQMRPMLQTLLTERFRMKLHREPKEMSVYVLVPGKGPAKVKEAEPGGQPGLSGGPSGATFSNQPISRLTFLLTRRMQRPVLDLTGLKGIYTYTLDLSGLPNMDTQAVENGPVPSIFAAIQNDLGLKMEARKMPIGVLVIDQVSKIPIEN